MILQKFFQSVSDSTAMAAHLSSPLQEYTPWGAALARRLPFSSQNPPVDHILHYGTGKDVYIYFILGLVDVNAFPVFL